MGDDDRTASRWRNYADAQYRSALMFSPVVLVFLIWVATPLSDILPPLVMPVFLFGAPAAIGLAYGYRWMHRRNEEAFTPGAIERRAPRRSRSESEAKRWLLQDLAVFGLFWVTTFSITPMVDGRAVNLTAIFTVPVLLYAVFLVRSLWWFRAGPAVR